MSPLRSLASARPAAAVVGVAMTVAVLSACGPDSQAAQSPSDKAAAAAAANLEADKKLAEKVNITFADLPSGFTAVKESFGTDAELAAKSTCVQPPATLLAATVRQSREFSYNLDRYGDEGGHLTSFVTVDASADQNARNFAVLSSDAYKPCVAASVQEHATLAGNDPVGTVSVTRSMAYQPLSVPSVSYEALVAYNHGGTLKVEHETDIQVSSGRLTAHLIVDRCCADEATPVWTQMLHNLSAELARAVRQ